MPWLYISFFHCFAAYEDSFLLQHNFRKLCIKPYNTFVRAGATCSYDNWDYRWIWTNFGQLLNWKTLECMTDERSNNKYFVTMKKCNRKNQRQLWKCVGERIKQTWPHWLGRSMYIYYVHGYLYVGTTKYWRSASKWTRFGSQKNVCSQGSQILKLFFKQYIYKIPLQTFMTGCFDTPVPIKLTAVFLMQRLAQLTYSLNVKRLAEP
jgi:hypothetical protein